MLLNSLGAFLHYGLDRRFSLMANYSLCFCLFDAEQENCRGSQVVGNAQEGSGGGERGSSKKGRFILEMVICLTVIVKIRSTEKMI